MHMLYERNVCSNFFLSGHIKLFLRNIKAIHILFLSLNRILFFYLHKLKFFDKKTLNRLDKKDERIYFFFYLQGIEHFNCSLTVSSTHFVCHSNRMRNSMVLEEEKKRQGKRLKRK